MGIFNSKRRKSADVRKAETMTLQQLIEFFGLHGVSAAELSEATYFSCIKVLSESIGKLPLKLQHYTPDRGIRIARDHRWYRTLNERPNPFMTASTFWAAMESFVDHYGNGYALIDEIDYWGGQFGELNYFYVVYDLDKAGDILYTWIYEDLYISGYEE